MKLQHAATYSFSVLALIALGCSSDSEGTGSTGGAGAVTPTGGADGFTGGTGSGIAGTGGTGVVNTGGSFVGSGGATTGGNANTGGIISSGGNSNSGGVPSSGGFMNTGGSTNMGGFPNIGGAMTTGGIGNTGGEATTGGRFGGMGGGTSAGGASDSGGAPSMGGGGAAGETSDTGGIGNTGGDPGTGGTTGTGGSTGVTFDCGLPDAGSPGVARPSGSPGGLEVIDWAGFSSAVSYTFDDSNSSQINHYDQMNALGVRYTFYLQTGKSESTNSVWQRALEDGHELGNHTQNHTCGSSDVDSAQDFIRQQFGVTAYTMAAPNGDTACQGSASKFFMIRSVSGGDISPEDNTNPAWIPSYIPGGLETTGGKWKVYCIHGFTGGNDGAYQPISFDSFTTAVEQAKSGGAWVDSVVNIGSYWMGQKLVTGSGTSYSWDLPANFPSGKCLRVTVDGGTPVQDGEPVAWNDHGYYEISLDAGSVTIE